MRIRGYDEETEEFVGGIEELSGKIADLTKSAEHPLGVSLFTDSSKTEYKSTIQLLRDISQIYGELSDKSQAGLLEALSGKRQGNITAAILNNFSAVESSLETMKNSAGSADREMGIIEQSIEYKINRLKETGVGVFQNLFKRQDVGVFVDGLTLVLNLVDGLSGALGTLGTILTTIGIAAFIKNLG